MVRPRENCVPAVNDDLFAIFHDRFHSTWEKRRIPGHICDQVRK